MRFSFSPKDILRLIRQRLFWFAIPFALFGIMGLIAISRMPPLYESSALLIVEGQQVPDEIIMSTIQSEAIQRLELVRAEVMARDNLIRIGERFGVFGGERLSRTDKNDWMEDRASIRVEQQLDTRAGRGDASVVTAKISFMDPDPNRAQQVANELMSQFESANISLRREQAGGTTDFILEEERKVRRALDALAEEIATIKQENPDALPDNLRFYESTVQRLLIDQSRTTAAIDAAETDLQQLQMQKSIYTSSELTPREQELADLKSALSRARQQYQDTYPTVVQLRRQVLDLEREVDPAAFRKNARTEIAALSRELAEGRKGTPDYAETEERIAELRGQLADLPKGEGSVSPGEVGYNGQVFALESRLNSLKLQGENLDRQITDMEARIAAVPAVESKLLRLINERERLENDLRQVQAKRAETERALALEVQAKAEKISAINRPVTPDEPTSPDKPKLALAVFALSAGLAGLLVLIPEVLFAKVQSKDHLKELLPDVPVVEVPRVKTADERMPKLIANASLIATTVVLGVALSWTAFQTLT